MMVGLSHKSQLLNNYSKARNFIDTMLSVLVYETYKEIYFSNISFRQRTKNLN